MAFLTLHKLLWGVAKSRKVDKWSIRAHEIPAIGLPSRVAASLLLAVRDQLPPADWEPEDGPLVWCLKRHRKLLASGRRLQLGYSELKVKETWHEKHAAVERSAHWDVPPHAAYYVPLVQGLDVHPASYFLYCDVLLFLTALDGGERILDSLHERGLAGVISRIL